MSTTSEKVSQFFSVCFGALLVLAIMGGIGYMMFGPKTAEGVVQNVYYSNSYSNDNTEVTITFDDGRKLKLRGVPNKSLHKGKKYKITYNGVDYVYNVEELD
jgi:hypothetical protein